jgi:crotonobetainyl-CoA:carnitine CoA-transferase CaiB-like acyl-CoA transferase
MYSLLSGIRIVDSSRLLPGAYATMKLADMGADVIKLELPPRGDYYRLIEPLHDGVGLLYMATNRNKRSIAVDLETPGGRETVERLLATADVFVEGSRPGAMAELGLDYDAVRRIKADIVYCSINGYGLEGPFAQLTAHGANLESTSGFLAIEKRPDGTAKAPNIRTFMASQAGGTHAALGIAAALVKRARTGTGAYIAVSCWESAVSWQYGNLTCLANLGSLFPGSEGLGPRYGCHQALDGKWVFVGLVEPKFWIRFCQLAEREDLAGRVHGDRAADFGADDTGLYSEIAAIVATRTQDDWVRLAIEHELPIAPVLTIEDVLDHPQTASQGVLAPTVNSRTGAPLRLTKTPVNVVGEEYRIVRPAPEFGEHTEEIVAELNSRGAP